MTEQYQQYDRPDKLINPLLRPLRSLVRLLRMLRYKAALRGRLKFGKNVFFGRKCYFSPPGFICIGNNVGIGMATFVETNLTIGDDVLISSHVSFVGNDHRLDDPSQSVFWSGRLPPSLVVLEGDNLIGHKSIIVGDVRIGKGCIIGAGAVVTKDMPSNTICCGIPARPIRARFPDLSPDSAATS